MRVLVVAPHPDDEILGVGGTIAKRACSGDYVYVCIATKGYEPYYTSEFVEKGRKEIQSADKLLGVKDIFFLDLPTIELDTFPFNKIVADIDNIIKRVNPEEVYVPHRGDIHIEHKIICDATMVCARPKTNQVVKKIYAYETLSETGWDIPNNVNDFVPNIYENISDYLHLKLSAMSLMTSQLQDYPNARSLKALEHLAGFRGATVGVSAAEAFMLIREVRM